MIKTRFCPSPTGLMHVGNFRTALFNVLAAGRKGSFLLRIEDTDQSRSYEAHTDTLILDLQHFDLNWQEGPQCGGSHGPYWQSKRQAIYDCYYEILLEKGLAYPCYCSDETLALNRKVQLANNQPPRYPGTCQHLTDAEKSAYEAEGIKPTLRYKIEDDIKVEFDDLVKGQQTYKGSDLSDFIIRRADGSAPFIYANAIDDALMKVTVALRGEDHLTNTPRQVSLLRALGLPEPQYGHISLILGDDGAPLSKRNGSKSVQALRETGYLKEAVLNYLARLGHYYANENLLTLEALSDQFEFKHLNRSPARYDESQLDYWQKQAVLVASDETLLNWINAPLPWSETLQSDFLKLVRENCVLPSDVQQWLKRLTDSYFVLTADCLEQLRHSTEKKFFEVAEDALDKTGTDFKAMSHAVKTALSVKGKQLFLPFRLALSGLPQGPELPLLLKLVGESALKKRFQYILEKW